MKRILLTLTAAIAAFPIWAAHPSHTNIWTGAGGDFNWNNAANWKDFATGGDWMPPTEAMLTTLPWRSHCMDCLTTSRVTSQGPVMLVFMTRSQVSRE